MDEFSSKNGCLIAGGGVILGIFGSLVPIGIYASVTVSLLGSCRDARLFTICGAFFALVSVAVIFLAYFGIRPFQKSGQYLRTAATTAAVIDTIYFVAEAAYMPQSCGLHSLF